MKTPRILAACCFCLPLFLPSAGIAEGSPPDYQTTGQIERKDGWITAQTAATVRVPLPPVQDVIRIRGKSGAGKAGLGISLRGANDKPILLRVSIQELRAYWGEQKGKTFSDAGLQVQLPGGRGGLFVRPNLLIYNEEKRAELAKAWDTLPAASAHPFTLELRRATTLQVWLDGQFIGEMPSAGTFSQCDISLAPGAALQAVETQKADVASGVLPLPVAEYSRPGAMEGAQIKLAPDAKLPQGLVLSSSGAGIDVGGLGRIPAASIDLQNYFWRHSALDALPEARLFSVPLATYSHVNLLCAAENDPAKTPSFTARLTRYGRSRGDAVADTQVTLPPAGAPDTPSTRRVGEVTFGPPDARQTTPLWLVRVPLKNGEIQDLLYDDQQANALLSTPRYLEFELLDPLRNVEADQQFPPSPGVTERTYKPGEIPHYRWNAARDPKTKAKFLPDDKPSSVHVFGAALEESPAALNVRANVPFLVFYASDKPELRATVTARTAGQYSVQWEFADVNGKIVAQDKKEVSLGAPQAQEVVSVPVKTANGWYATRFQLRDSGGTVLVDDRSAFVFLPPDTRKAGFESPFGSWWFHWAHGGEPNIEKVGPILQRAGLRHTQLPDSLPESVTKKYGVTAWMIPWLRHPESETLTEKLAEHEELIRKYQTLWPSVDKMMIWHESGDAGAPFPSELHGETPKPLDEKSEQAWQERIEYITALAKMVREKYPHLKMQYGNNGNSIRSVGELLRRKFPREYIDAIATEDLGQVIIPERWMLDSLQSAWFLRETARKLGYADLPSTAAYEWLGRRAPSTGTKDQAEWVARDALHALAYGFKSIPLGLIHDAGGGYYHSIWGASGLTRRYPVMEPRPSYASLATLTRVLDSAKFEREIPTNFLSLYVLEFRRGNDWVYALWTPRGERKVTLRLSGKGGSTLTDLYGREKSLTGAELNLTVTTAPQYLTSPSRLNEVAGGAAAFPEDAPPKDLFIVNKMDKAADWTIDNAASYDRGGDALPRRKQGAFELREVNDAEMGPCLELELKPDTKLDDLTEEYVFLKLNQPLTGPGPYDNAGIWVKGNGGWGEVQFVAQSEKRSFLAGNIYYQSWSGQNALSFEGWNFLRYPLDHDQRWNGQGTITGLLITMPRKTLHLTELKTVPELKIRLKGVSMF
jgi:hypothetical protein